MLEWTATAAEAGVTDSSSASANCEKFAVVMNHPAATSGEQIAFDFRHITRSVIRDCYAGNYPRSNCKPRPASQPEAIRGFGVVLGTMSSGLPLYSGGEVNTIDSVAGLCR